MEDEEDKFFGDVVSSYTSEEAINDGILVDIGKFSNVINIATSNLLESKKYIDGDKLNVPCIMDLVKAGHHIIQSNKSDHFYSGLIEFPDGTKGKVFIAQNEYGKFTIMLPEDY